MNRIIFILSLLFISYGGVLYSQSFDLIPLQNDTKYGYLNLKGDTVIPFSYDEASFFSDGVAVVRKGGYYGYINENNKFILPPIYDYAETFHKNRAVVYKGQKKYVIDKKGNKIFALDFFQEVFPITTLSYNNNGYSIFQYKKNNICVLDTNGNQVLKVKKGNIEEFSSNLYFVVKGGEMGLYNIKQHAWIFKLGQIKGTHFDMYGTISPIDINYQNDNKQFFYAQLDSNGNLTNQTPIKDPNENVKYLGNGLYQKLVYPKGEYNRHTLIVCDTKNTEVIRDTTWDDIFQFFNETAFLKTNNNGFRLINNKFKYITDSIYNYVAYPYFKKLFPLNSGVANVRNDNMDWGLINEKSEFIIPQKYKILDVLDYKKGILIAAIEDSGYTRLETKYNRLLEQLFKQGAKINQDTTTKRDSTLDKELFNITKDYPVETNYFGLIDYKGNNIIPFKFKKLSATNYGEDILYFKEDSYHGLIRLNGEIIFKIKLNKDNERLKNLSSYNIGWKNRAYFEVKGSGQKPQETGLALFGVGSQNYTKPNIELPHNIPLNKKSIIIYVDTLQKDTFQNRYSGFPVYIINNSVDTIFVGVQDSRLYMRVQAKDENGKWMDIEYVPSSWCGNSYYTIFLNRDEFWKLATPKYEGAIKTKLRIVFEDRGGYGMGRKATKNYSNEYNGSINPSQFFRKQDYISGGLMDPYTN